MNPWSPPPDPVPPLGVNVHVWAIDLDIANFDASSWHDRLSSEEHARAARFKFERDQRRFIVAHTAVREIIAGYLKAPPAKLQFNDGPNGKPKLAPPFNTSGIEFNLSHSHEKAVLAVNQAREIGIDIEFVREDFEFQEVAGHFFTRREIAALNALPPSLQRRAFYKCWTSKEAFLKAKGTGLSGEVDEVVISLDGEHVRIQADVAGWSLNELDPIEGCEAALVSETRPLEIFHYRWLPAWSSAFVELEKQGRNRR